MRIYLLVLMISFFSFLANAQIDTTDWYPLAVGNIWQYASTSLFTPTTYITYTVIKDTTFTSGKTYKKIKQENSDLSYVSFRYERFEDNKVYIPGTIPINNCTAGENILYDLNKTPGSIWQNCMVYRSALLTHRGLVAKGLTSSPTFFSGLLQYASFTDVMMNGPDTIWHPLQAPSMSALLCKGIGLYNFSGGESHFSLNAAKINGKYYGVLFHVTEPGTEVSPQLTLDLYPNPCNNGTIIEFNVAKEVPIQISVYSAIGEKVDELALGSRPSGMHSFRYNNSTLGSGVYFIHITAENQIASKKLVLLK